MEAAAPRELTPAERNYEKQKEAVRRHYRKKHPEVKRVRKPQPPPNAVQSV